MVTMIVVFVIVTSRMFAMLVAIPRGNRLDLYQREVAIRLALTFKRSVQACDPEG
jgi:hypothetical protein